MKGASNRQVKTDRTGREIEFFFPKANPPITIMARNRREAEEKLRQHLDGNRKEA